MNVIWHEQKGAIQNIFENSLAKQNLTKITWSNQPFSCKFYVSIKVSQKKLNHLIFEAKYFLKFLFNVDSSIPWMARIPVNKWCLYLKISSTALYWFFFFTSNQLYPRRLWSYTILLLSPLSIQNTDGQGNRYPARRDCSHEAYRILLSKNVSMHAWILLWMTPYPSY